MAVGRRRRGVLPVLLAVGVVLLGSGAALVSLAVAHAPNGRTSAPPWSAPSDVAARAQEAGLALFAAEGKVLHRHEHLSITIDGAAVTVPAHLGIDRRTGRVSPLHTHDTTGIIHVESPVRRSFRLGQLFTEWDVALAPGRVGPWQDGAGGVRVALFVNGRRSAQDPRAVVLGARQDLDLVVTTDGSRPVPPPRYRLPRGY